MKSLLECVIAQRRALRRKPESIRTRDDDDIQKYDSFSAARRYPESAKRGLGYLLRQKLEWQTRPDPGVAVPIFSDNSPRP